MRIPSTLSSFTVGTFSLASGSSVHQLIPRRHSGNADISHEETLSEPIVSGTCCVSDELTAVIRGQAAWIPPLGVPGFLDAYSDPCHEGGP
ncbi:hypothetical protein SAY86_029383 [Trapa natans]|uniref:Uncharacterized protein n=1 Tax=Trapa natans TaxID=22666 RepID=A0AAN7RBV6_TRANT|nr:hypothetical protein SAY86_029383 [Trapa natans]